MKNLKSYFQLIISFIITFVVIAIVNPQSFVLLIISPYFFLLHILSQHLLEKKQQKSPKLFISAYLAITMIRLFVHILALILLFVLFNEKFLIAALFFVNYSFFSSLEVFKWLKKKDSVHHND